MNTSVLSTPAVRSVVGGLIVLLLLGVGAAYYKATHSVLADITDLTDRSEVSVVLTEQGFEPQHIRIRLGTRVTFTTTRDKQYWPASNPHPSHGLYPGFDPERPIKADESWTFEPTQKGVWGYHDHVRSYYTGILYVE